MTLKTIGKLAIASSALFFLLGCSKMHEEKNVPEWWHPMQGTQNAVLEIFELAPGETKKINVKGAGTLRLGLLVKQVKELRAIEDKNGDGSALIYFQQVSSKKRVGTYFSASVLFDMSLGDSFEIQNKSPISTDVAVFRDDEK